MIPIVRCSRMAASLRFYTEQLDFELLDGGGATEDPAFCVLGRQGSLLFLSSHAGDGTFGQAVAVAVGDVDEVFRRLRARGLEVPTGRGSPVHEGPVAQTWGTRELYVDDPDGNTVRFVEGLAVPKPPGRGEFTGPGQSRQTGGTRERTVPHLPADDLGVAREFYVTKLGFRVTFEASDDGKHGILGLARGGMRVIVDSPMEGHGRNACVSLEVADVDAYFEEWSPRVEVLRPPKDEPWGARTFDLLDPFGNTLFVMGPIRRGGGRGP